MSKPRLQNWERKFRRDAHTDKLRLFKDHLRNLELEQETTPELMLEGTILVVSACCAYASMDGQRVDALLAAQTYDPAQSAASTYSFTFDLCGKSSARQLVAEDLKVPDLADLFGHPWGEYRVCGYSSVLITRLDGQIRACTKTTVSSTTRGHAFHACCCGSWQLKSGKLDHR